jgi:hypothetical protein
MASGYDGFVVWQSMVAPAATTALLLRSRGALEVNHGHVSPAARKSVSVLSGTQWTSSAFRSPPVDAPTLWNFTASEATSGVYARSQGGAPVFASFGDEPAEPVEPLSIGAGDDGSDPTRVQISEVILFDRPLSANERIGVVASLREKWGFAEPACGGNQSLGPDGGCYAVIATAP